MFINFEWCARPPKNLHIVFITTRVLTIISTVSCALHWPAHAQKLSHHADGEDRIKLSEREHLPDVLATSVPLLAIPGKANAEIRSDEPTLHLRSSLHNISGIGGYPLFAFPIMSSELAELLSKTQADLHTHPSNRMVSSYQCSTTRWSFSILLANTTMQYASFEEIIKRFLKLSSSTATGSDEIVSTRVGVVFRDSAPIADITMMPRRIVNNSSCVPFAKFGRQPSLSTTQPVEVMRVTPFGSTCAYQLLNETEALAPYLDYRLSHQTNLTARSLETEIFIRVGETVYMMSMHLLRDPNGFPREVGIWAFRSVLLVGYAQIIFATTMELFRLWPTVSGDYPGNDERGFDTGFYVVGRMLARLIIWTTHTAILMMFAPRRMWKEIIATLLRPLQGLGGFETAWATEGEIYAPSNTTDDTREIVARWQIWMGDYDEWDNRGELGD